MKLHVGSILLVSVLAACGGSDDPEDTICEKADSCIDLTDEEVAACRDAAAQAPEGVVSECASCVSSHSCSEIGTGACDVQCNGIDFSGEPSREENAATICTRASECNLNPPPTCVSDVVNSSATDDVVASCAACTSTHTCQELDVGVCDVECN